jgi:ATP-dependent RNA helicase DDX24/MAK5
VSGEKVTTGNGKGGVASLEPLSHLVSSQIIFGEEPIFDFDYSTPRSFEKTAMTSGEERRLRKKQKRQAHHPAGGHTSLAWRPVPLPQEALASGGQSEADFFRGLNFDDDDYMGIKEVEGVEVVKKDDGTIVLVDESSKKSVDKPQVLKSGLKKRKAKEEIRDEAALEKGEGAVEVEMEAETEVDLPDVILSENDEEDEGDEEDVESSREGDDIEAADEEHNADFRLLMGDNADKATDIAWSKKKYAKELPGWNKIDITLDDRLKTSLKVLTFEKPTPIQAMSMNLAMNTTNGRRDVVGIAQTGSGKTLAYGLPILQWICENAVEDRQMKLLDGVEETEEGVRLAGLVLAPTRELALQVSKHLEAVIAASSSDEKSRWASIATLTGGISEEKQKRILLGYNGRGADIIVATPGRLWDMCKSDDVLTKRIKLTRFLVVDEADRMIETGHFAEMENILALVKRAESINSSELVSTASISGGAADMQTLIFSATLSKELQNNLKKAKRKRKSKPSSTLDELISMIDFRDEDPKIVDLSTKTRMPARLMESKIECLSKEKDLYLYYFLLRYPGRTLVFLNSIDGIRRLLPLLENLLFSVQPLHSQLQQKQRLKNLDRFKSSRLPSIQGSSVLLATDVAARGLDISAVDHVVHFQLPRSADTYVHRSGRTARAGQSGISLALVEPAEKRLWRDLSRSLKRCEYREAEILLLPYSNVCICPQLTMYHHCRSSSPFYQL